VSEHKRKGFQVWGFSPWRVAIMLCPVAFILAPAHAAVPCAASGVLVGISWIPFGLVVLLTVVARPETDGWYWPSIIAFWGAIANMLSWH
jgi:hypothetical protein